MVDGNRRVYSFPQRQQFWTLRPKKNIRGGVPIRTYKGAYRLVSQAWQDPEPVSSLPLLSSRASTPKERRGAQTIQDRAASGHQQGTFCDRQRSEQRDNPSAGQTVPPADNGAAREIHSRPVQSKQKQPFANSVTFIPSCSVAKAIPSYEAPHTSFFLLVFLYLGFGLLVPFPYRIQIEDCRCAGPANTNSHCRPWRRADRRERHAGRARPRSYQKHP